MQSLQLQCPVALGVDCQDYVTILFLHKLALCHHLDICGDIGEVLGLPGAPML